jgi:hypothetical protein
MVSLTKQAERSGRLQDESIGGVNRFVTHSSDVPFLGLRRAQIVV